MKIWDLPATFFCNSVIIHLFIEIVALVTDCFITRTHFQPIYLHSCYYKHYCEIYTHRNVKEVPSKEVCAVTQQVCWEGREEGGHHEVEQSTPHHNFNLGWFLFPWWFDTEKGHFLIWISGMLMNILKIIIETICHRQTLYNRTECALLHTEMTHLLTLTLVTWNLLLNSL